MVTGGLKNGILVVGGKPSYVFSYDDLKNHRVAYKHDDSGRTYCIIAFNLFYIQLL